MLNQAVEAYPLHWPEGWKRNVSRRYGQFKSTLDRARREVQEEIRKLGGTDVIISTNLKLRRDGMPFATGSMRVDDPGVAVYFRYKGKDMVFACDQYIHIHSNMVAIAKSIFAIRGLERWGASDMMERAFTGFKRLPEKASQPWLDVLELRALSHVGQVNAVDVDAAFKRLAKKYHPDVPETGDAAKFQDLMRAREDAFRELKVA